MPHSEYPKNIGRPDLPLKPNGKRWNAATSYQPEYCDVLLDLMREGASYYEVARHIGVTQKTLLNWAKNFEEFGKAYEMGKDWARGWFEKQARECLVIETEYRGTTKKFDTGIYKHTMAVRFGEHESNPAVNVNVSNDSDVSKTIDLVNRLRQEIL